VKLGGGLDLAALRAAFARRGSIRIEGFLDDEVARAVRDACRALAHELRASVSDDLAFQYWGGVLVPEAACDHVLCRFGRWLWDDALAWIGELTGIRIAPPADRVLMSTLYDKGSYLDPHNDWDGRRKVAFVLGLTDSVWPAEEGGHLEFLGCVGARVTIEERRPPGWNTLDLFDVRRPDRNHAIPIVRRRVERRAISGWLY
jgi:hypothetical protein